ncbi:NADAR family protein [Streptomyces sp. NPDC093252]|uniref:NADAR family protein n=1 Tax=Streptomyces sp. NPDC093252 TaxID=3154980 RepID=UPI00341794C4
MTWITGVPDSVDALVSAIRDGARPRFLPFWKHHPPPDGRLDAACLSQWRPSPFVVDGVRYATAEHWMMAGKDRLFEDPEAERQALTARHPAEAKKAGALVRGFDEAVWRRERLRIVTEGNVHKFASDPALRAFLVGTGSRVLVEASPMDRIWGIGLPAGDPAVQEPEHWRGLNLLGFALMAARERLRAETAGSGGSAPGAVG